MPLSPLDVERLQQAHELAQASIGLSEPNPRVGCILGHANGQILGSGHTQEAGGAHAEVMALRQARASGADCRGATAWVTLEPCAHHGRTPPCCDALIAAGISRVVASVLDPFDQVNGAGFQRLRDAGIAVALADGDLAKHSRELNIGFFSRILRRRPWVRMKIAASLDGRTALLNGASQWITSEAARTDGHAWRKRAGAVLTGIGTLLEDDPRLDVRLVPTVLQPLRVVVDSRLETPPAAKLLKAPGKTLIFCASDSNPCASALQDCGAELVALPDAAGKVDLAAMLDELARRNINELHVEAGHRLNASLLRADLVDELLVYLAPQLLGAGRDMAALGPFESLAQALKFSFIDLQLVGPDIRLRARPHRRADF